MRAPRLHRISGGRWYIRVNDDLHFYHTSGARIVTSSAVAAEYVSKKLRSTGVHLVGSVGIVEELQKAKVPLRWNNEVNGQVEAFNGDGHKVDASSFKVNICNA